jgi:hypothetical protein
MPGRIRSFRLANLAHHLRRELMRRHFVPNRAPQVTHGLTNGTPHSPGFANSDPSMDTHIPQVKTPLSSHGKLYFLLLGPICRRRSRTSEERILSTAQTTRVQHESLEFAPAAFFLAAKRRRSLTLVTRRRISTDCPCAELSLELCQRCESAGTNSLARTNSGPRFEKCYSYHFAIT